MIEVICINDSNKPRVIPKEKWVKKGNIYHVIFTTTVLPQKKLAFLLSEIELTDKELPYEYFDASRFAFTEENLALLLQMIKDCNDSSFSMEELLKQTELQEQ